MFSRSHRVFWVLPVFTISRVVGLPCLRPSNVSTACSLRSARNLLLVLALLFPVQRAGAVDYIFQTLEMPEESSTSTEGHGISNDGSIIVSSLPSQHSFLRSPSGSYSAFAYPERTATIALGLNDNGTVVGDVWDENMQSYVGFIRAGSGDFSAFTYPTTGDFHGIQANDVNDEGTIVGGFSTSDSAGAFVRSPAGEFSSFQYLDDDSTIAYGINNQGQISGWSPSGSFLREPDGTFTAIAFTGATETQTFGINNLGQVVGYYVLPGFPSAVVHGYVRDSSGSFETVDFPGAVYTTIWDINDLGQLSGTYMSASNKKFAFLATPVPEPSAIVLLTLGGFVLLSRRFPARQWLAAALTLLSILAPLAATVSCLAGQPGDEGTPAGRAAQARGQHAADKPGGAEPKMPPRIESFEKVKSYLANVEGYTTLQSEQARKELIGKTFKVTLWVDDVSAVGDAIVVKGVFASTTDEYFLFRVTDPELKKKAAGMDRDVKVTITAILDYFAVKGNQTLTHYATSWWTEIHFKDVSEIEIGPKATNARSRKK